MASGVTSQLCPALPARWLWVPPLCPPAQGMESEGRNLEPCLSWTWAGPVPIPTCPGIPGVQAWGKQHLPGAGESRDSSSQEPDAEHVSFAGGERPPWTVSARCTWHAWHPW